MNLDEELEIVAIEHKLPEIRLGVKNLKDENGALFLLCKRLIDRLRDVWLEFAIPDISTGGLSTGGRPVLEAIRKTLLEADLIDERGRVIVEEIVESALRKQREPIGE